MLDSDLTLSVYQFAVIEAFVGFAIEVGQIHLALS